MKKNRIRAKYTHTRVSNKSLLTNVLQDLIDGVEELPPSDEKALEFFLRRTRLIVRKAFSEDSKYLKEIGEIDFHSKKAPISKSVENEKWIDEVERLRKIFFTMKKDYQLSTGEQFQKTLGDKRDKFL